MHIVIGFVVWFVLMGVLGGNESAVFPSIIGGVAAGWGFKAYREQRAMAKLQEAQARANTNASTDILLKIYLYGIRGGLYDPSQGEYVDRVISDGEFHDILRKRLESVNVRAKSLAKLNIDVDMVKEIPPVELRGFVYEGADAARPISGGKYVSNLYQISWLYFSDTQVYIYSYILDLIDSRLSSERTEDYFYKDITSLSTATETLSVKVKSYNNEEAPREIKVSSNSLHIIVPGSTRRISVTGVSNAEEIIQGIQQKVREKKMA